MMRGPAFFLAIALPLATAGATPLLPTGPSADQRLAEARKEAGDSARELDRLNQAVTQATDEAARRKAEQDAAAAAISDAEARITEADAEVRLTEARAALGKARLDQQRAPIASLLGGLVNLDRTPPVLALLDGSSPDELVRVKALFDAIDPVIRQRTATLSAEYQAQVRLAAVATDARKRLADNRAILAQRQQQFAELERAAADHASQLTAQSLSAGDRVMADREGLLGAEGAAQSEGAALAEARRIAGQGLSPPRPVRGDAPLPASDFAYLVPVDAPVRDGVGSVSQSGIVARGTSFSAVRGAAVMAPASGVIRFAGPFRRSDGLVIIDHGNRRTSLLLGVATTLVKGDKVEIGQRIGIATGPVAVEFRDNGQIKSPAFIAASSPPLSNAANTR